MSLNRIMLSALLLLIACIVPSYAENVTCTECGMAADTNSKFAARIGQDKASLPFCDIGDMFSYLKRKKPANIRPEVKDFPSGEWIDARTAFYVHAEKKFKTPMGWGIAAFRDRSRASEYGDVMDYETVQKR